MTMLRGYAFRLYATDAQEKTFARWAGATRAVYNAALFQREYFWRKGRTINFATQGRELTALRAEMDWVKDLPVTAAQQALKDLQKAFDNFFRDMKKPQQERHFKYPTPRRKFQNDSFRFVGREVKARRLNKNWGVVTLPKVGEVRFRWTRDIPEDIRMATVIRSPRYWQVVFQVSVEDSGLCAPDEAVGIDRGVANSIALSTGELPEFPREHIRMLERKAGNWQRKANARKRGSRRYAKARKRAAVLKAKAATCRKHWNNEQTTAIANRFGIVVLEDLKIGNMTRSAKGTVEEPGKKVAQKAGLNRSILETGWGQFEQMLTYKLAERGGELRKVNPKNTSRKCRKCHHIDARNRESQATFRCVACGHEEHADIHAACNILEAGTQPSRFTCENLAAKAA